jgi:hypothetical protein
MAKLSRSPAMAANRTTAKRAYGFGSPSEASAPAARTTTVVGSGTPIAATRTVRPTTG